MGDWDFPLNGLLHKALRGQYDESKHPRKPRGAQGGGQFAPKGGAAAASGHDGIPERMQNTLDGGIGHSILYHGTSSPAHTFDNKDLVYLADNSAEAEGYARDIHRMGISPAGAKAKRQVLAVRRKPGRARNIDNSIFEAFESDEDIDEVIAREAKRARADGFRYLYFTHPSNVDGDREQDVVISLYPNEDLRLMMRLKVKA